MSKRHARSIPIIYVQSGLGPGSAQSNISIKSTYLIKSDCAKLLCTPFSVPCRTELTLTINSGVMHFGCLPLSFIGQVCFLAQLELFLLRSPAQLLTMPYVLSPSQHVTSCDIFHNIFSQSLALWETEANHLSELGPHKQKAESITAKCISEQRLFNINVLAFSSRHEKNISPLALFLLSSHPPEENKASKQTNNNNNNKTPQCYF